MKQLISYILQAIAVLSGLRASNKALTEENQALRDELAKQGPTIADLQAKLAAEELDDAALVEAKTNAETALAAANERATALQADSDEAIAAGAKLAEALTADPQTPSVDPGTLEVLGQNDGDGGDGAGAGEIPVDKFQGAP